MAATEEANAKDLDRLLFSTSQIADAVGMHRQTVRKYLEQGNVFPVVDEPKRKLYKFSQAVRCIIQTAGEETSTDRRNLAQARMAEVQTAILERKYIPVEEIAPVVRSYFSAQNAIIQNSNLEDDEKERLFKKAQDLAKKLENIA